VPVIPFELFDCFMVLNPTFEGDKVDDDGGDDDDDEPSATEESESARVRTNKADREVCVTSGALARC
jgi:hypothetical protein